MSAFAKGILSNLFSKTAVAGIGLLTVIVVSRFLGAEGRGEIGLFMSTVALVQLICDFGNSTAIINLSYKHNNKNLWLSSLIWIAIICLLTYPVLLLFSHLPFVWLIPPAAFLYSIINLNHLILMGNQKVHLRNISLLVFPVVLLILFFVLSKLIGFKQSNYIISLFLALSVSVIVSYSMCRKHLISEQTFVFQREILNTGFWAQSAQAIQFFNYRLNFFLLAFFILDVAAANYAIGVYNNAIILSESVWILGHSIAQMQHMKILNTESLEKNFKLTNHLMYLNFFGTCLLMLILILIPETFWTQLFSADFIQIRQLFLVTVLGVMAFGLSNILNHALHASSRFKAILLCNTIGLIAGASAGLVLIPHYQLMGAAAAWSIGLFVAMLSYVLVYIYQHLKFISSKQLVFQAILSLFIFLSSIMLFRYLNLGANWHFMQRFFVSLSGALTITVSLNFLAGKLMHGFKPHNS